MYAIIEESGGQRKVTADEIITIDLYQGGEGKVGDTITFDKVLMFADEGKMLWQMVDIHGGHGSLRACS